MLSEIAADVLQFLTRRDLDKACGVSKWLDALMAQCCEVYPLRRVAKISLHQRGNDFAPTVVITKDDGAVPNHSFSSMDEAARFTAFALCHSYLDILELGDHDEDSDKDLCLTMLLPDHWTALVDAVRCGDVRNLSFSGVDLSSLDSDVFRVAVGWPGLESLAVRHSVVLGGFVSDDLLRCCPPTRNFGLFYYANESDTPHGVSDDAIFDFLFSVEAASGGRWHSLLLECTGVTEMFLAKFLERLRSTTARVSASLALYDAPEQRGLSAHAQYLESGGVDEAEVTYHIPVVDDDNTFYEVIYFKGPSNTHFSAHLSSSA